MEKAVPIAGAVRLNLGGAGEGFCDGRVEGFLTVDLREGPGTDIVGNARDLNMFRDGTVDCIYASQILEHFPIAETVNVLREWYRVLKPGAHLYISVPDFDAAVKLYLLRGLTQWLTYHLWGDQKHPLNFHYLCFTFPTLAKAVTDAGFSDVKRIEQFPFEVRDGSRNVDTVTGQFISLNVEAIK